jgi:hypothetical protein
MYFESTISYWTDNPDGFKPPRILVKRTILVRAYTYTEVEAITTDWGTKETNEDFKVSPIKETDIISVVGEGEKFFKVVSYFPEVTPKGKVKMQKAVLMVRSSSDTEAIERTKQYFDFLSDINDLVIKSVTLTEIETYLKID